jgi:glycine cleavage system protein P-like pyridoxal-binding family
MLENKDISLVHSMIPLGSCTMKLNATTEMIVKFLFIHIYLFNKYFIFNKTIIKALFLARI